MLAVKLFLWILVATLFMQGFLNAESYGSAPTMLGGMGLTMAILKESLFTTNLIGIPRIFVQIAIKETQRHPSTAKIPIIQKRIKILQHSLKELREADLMWSLDYSDLVSGLLADDDALALWNPIFKLKQNLIERMNRLRLNEAEICNTLWITIHCNNLRRRMELVRYELVNVTILAKPWEEILNFQRALSMKGYVPFMGRWAKRSKKLMQTG
jgi:hypothetical protein